VVAAVLANGSAYQRWTYATMYHRNMGVKWGVDLESITTRLLEAIQVMTGFAAII
jgi:hypothetical protein